MSDTRATDHPTRNTQYAAPSRQSNIILTGFMGTGKTSIGRYIAAQLGRPFVDLDDLIVQRAGKPIPQIFAEDGEPAFRALESALCAELRGSSGLVVATGGGAVVHPGNREALAAGGIVICLDASLDAILARVGDDVSRPMLAGPDRRARIRDLLAQRADAYAAIPLHLDTTGLTILAAAERVMGIAAGLPEGGHRLIVNPGWQEGDGKRRTPGDPAQEIPSALDGAQPAARGYSVLIARGLLAQAGRRIREAGIAAGRCAVITNSTVGGPYAGQLSAALTEAGLEPILCEVPDGEIHKTLGTVSRLYEQLAAAGLARGEPIIALGGGVIGDMAGFVAATWLRGVPFVQIPTSLLAMVDASVGGKVGVDLPQGKNLVGAFKQPALVLMDPDLLATLPPAEFRCGVAEIIKAGIIADPALFRLLACEDETSGHLLRHPGGPAGASSPDDTALIEVIAAAVRVKADIVARDPFEAGERAWLNLGHTFGHALELISGFTLRHGEAVGIGLIAAAVLSARLGLCPADLPGRVRRAVARHGLPTRFPCNPPDVLAAMATDKKRRGRNLRFVVIREIGRVEVAEAVPPEAVLDAIAAIAAPAPSCR